MLTALTPRELADLAHKLSDGSHAAYNVAHTLAYAAGLFPIDGPAETRIWNARRRWEALADELAGLAGECRAARAALAVDV